MCVRERERERERERRKMTQETTEREGRRGREIEREGGERERESGEREREREGRERERESSVLRCVFVCDREKKRRKEIKEKK